MNITRLTHPYFSRIYRAELRAAQSVEQSQRKLLSALLDAARRTQAGRLHSFSSLASYSDFAAELPVAAYPQIRADVMSMMGGEPDVLWPGRTSRFAQSSGTSDGKSKYIPITPRSLARCHYAGAAFSLASYLHFHPESRIFGGRSFILGGSFANELTLPSGVKVGDLSATLIDRINPLVNLVRVPSKRIALMEDWTIKLPALIKASVNADIRSISGVPSWFLTVLKGVMERAGANAITDVWPNLEVFFHGGIAFGPYRDQYAAITAPKGINYWENYNASEGFFAVQCHPESPAMRLLMNVDVFYEFIPVSTPDARPIPAWEVAQGEIYELIITSGNGLWRYRIGDTVRIESTDPLQITIAGRTHHYINAFGEEVMVYNADAAIAAASRTTGLDVLNYTAAPLYASEGSRGRHQWLVEFAAPPEAEALAAFATALDAALCRENSDYQAKRAGSLFLDPPEVIAAQPGLFDRWLATTGKLGGQRKIPRLANDRRFITPLLSMNQT